MVALDRCASCGAYRYLAVRERMKSFEFVLLHVSVKQSEGRRTEKRITKVVAKVSKLTLERPGHGINVPRKGDSLISARRETVFTKPGLIPGED